MNTIELDDVHVGHVMAHTEILEKIHADRMALKFPEEKAKISKLSLSDKLEWYATKIQSAGQMGSAPLELMTKEFERFWKWRVLIPMKIMRFAYKVKNWEFKKHSHISEIRKKLKENAHLI